MIPSETDRLLVPLDRQFRLAILIVTVLVKLMLPARQQILRLDGQDEGGAARDGGDPRASVSFRLSRNLAANRLPPRIRSRGRLSPDALRGDDKMKQHR